MDTRLQRFSPLKTILTFDDFDRGLCGWSELIGNYSGHIGNVPPIRADMRPPQLSNGTFFDVGTHGAMDGTYTMKIATRPRRGHFGVALKRLTSRKDALYQFEMWFSFKSEARIGANAYDFTGYDGNFHPSEREFGAFTIGTDIVSLNDEVRSMSRLRYVNADDDGNIVRRWYYNDSVDPTTKVHLEGRATNPTDYQVMSPDDWKPIPGGEIAVCYNELPTKMNWHYLRWRWDTRTRRGVELQLGDVVLDLRDIPVPTHADHYDSLRSLMNVSLNVRANTSTRNFLFVDSAVVSTDA